MEDNKTYNTLHVIENKKNKFTINSKIIVNSAGNFAVSLFEKIFFLLSRLKILGKFEASNLLPETFIFLPNNTLKSLLIVFIELK